MKTSDLRRWAVVGAQQRLVEIDNERRAIYEAFPELRGNRGAKAISRSSAESLRPAEMRGPRRMSAAARKRISNAQKARWARQRAGKK